MGQGQLEDKKRRKMEEIETGWKKKNIPFKERRTDSGGRIADCGLVECDHGPCSGRWRTMSFCFRTESYALEKSCGSRNECLL